MQMNHTTVSNSFKAGICQLVCFILLILQPLAFCTEPCSLSASAQELEASRPCETFVKRLWTQIAQAPLEEAFSNNFDTIKEYLHEHLEEMVEKLFSTQKTQKAQVKNPDFSFTVKVRQRDDKVEILAGSTCGKGGFKTIAKVVQLAGPALKHQPGPIYAYAKSTRRKRLKKQLKELEGEIASASTSEERERLESSAAAIKSKLRQDQTDLTEEIRISQLLPDEENFIKMWPVEKHKDSSQIKGLLMEYCPYSLRDAIAVQKHPLSDEDFLQQCQFALAISKSLAAMHSSKIGLCHLDVKAGNILIKDENGALVPKITDFGLTEKIGTPSNGPRGTLPYMAPEHFDLSVETFAPPMDNWGLGMILVELFYGKAANVFWTNSDVGYVGSHFNDSSRYPEFLIVWQLVREQVIEQLTLYPDLDPLISGLLTIDPAKRFTAQQAAELFENIISRLPSKMQKKSISTFELILRQKLAPTEWDDPRDVTLKSNSKEVFQ
jgi:serine/threonine protein kinase